MILASHRAYLSAKGRVVREGDPAAAVLLVGVGQPVPAEHEAAYTAFVEAASGPAVKAEKPAEDKAIHRAPANKAVKKRK